MLTCIYRQKSDNQFLLWKDTYNKYRTFDKLSAAWDHNNYVLIMEIE